jgi:hypothetical protein
MRYTSTPLDIARRALLWTVICGVSAIPSFMWAYREFNPWAMVTGIALFIAAYTFSTSTPAFLRFREKPFVRRTLYIGYGTRLIVAIILPVGAAIDLWPGLLSINIVSRLTPFSVVGDFDEFIFTLLTTIVQGTILNAIMSVYMGFVWALQAAVCKWPQEKRGFPVEMVKQPEPTQTGA